MTKQTQYRAPTPQKRPGVSTALAFVLPLLPVLLAIQSAFAAATCTLNTANRTVTICTPSNGATVNTTFHVNAGSTDTTAAVTYMQVYVNGVKKLTQNRNFIDADLTLPPGSNQRFTVQAHDSAGVLFKTVYHINVIAAPGTVVNFNPTSLNFFIIRVGFKRSLTTTLTNTGSTALSISGIAITGSTAFSQTNTCDGSVVAKGSCTITVTFMPPKAPGNTSYRGAVSVSDNGGGSPQQVPLSGLGKQVPGASAAARSALATSQTAAVPSTTGPSMVGTRMMDLVDSTRDDPFLANGTKRELLVRFWYPASITQSCERAEYTSPAVWSYFSELVGVRLPEVKTNSCLDAPITENPHPVIVFTHGYTGTFTDYTFLFEDLASRGYVVASVDHTYEATAVQFPDGRFVKSVLGSHLAENTLRSGEQGLSFAVWTRSNDLKFVADELARLNGEASGPFAGKLDLSRVAVAGHSLGGLAALLALKQDARFKAAVLVDASLPDGSASVTETPVLLLAMGREQWSDEECRLWSGLIGPRFAVNLTGAEHLTPSDAVWLAQGAIKTGTMGTEKSVAAVRDYIAAFLDTNLQGKPSGALLTRSSSDYPDAAVTAQEQRLCGEGP